MKRLGSRVLYYPLVTERDIPALDSAVRDRVRLAIESKLTSSPEIYGSPLRGLLRPCWKLRVGDYRVIYKLAKEEVEILAIVHRKDVYKMLERRL